MSFPTFWRGVRDTIRKTVLHRRVARRIASKAGLRGIVSTPGAKTVIDAYINPLEEALGRQYIADLTGATRMRLTSESNVPVWVRYSIEGATSNALRPPDYSTLHDPDELEYLSASRADAASGADLHWLTIPEELRVPMRLCVSTQINGEAMNAQILDGSFSVAMQVE